MRDLSEFPNTLSSLQRVLTDLEWVQHKLGPLSPGMDPLSLNSLIPQTQCPSIIHATKGQEPNTPTKIYAIPTEDPAAKLRDSTFGEGPID